MIKLFDYQKEALENLKAGSVLWGGTGDGKSLVSLIFFYEKECAGCIQEEFMTAECPKDLYIITTAKKRDSLEWQKECIPFKFELSGINVVIDSWNNIKKYSEVQNAFFIFDEQRLVGNGAWVKAYLKIAKSNRWILLTATPGDTYSDYIPIFLAHGFYRNRTEFIREHVVYDRYVKYKISKYICTHKIDKYIAQVLVKMERPKTIGKIYNDILCNYDKKLMEVVYKDRWDPYVNEPIENAASWCYLQRKVCNSDHDRLTKLYDILTMHKKVIIFYNFDYELEMLLDFFNLIKTIQPMEIAQWNGHKHEDLPTGNSWAYLLQYSAGAEAWNCITTNVVIFFSLNYSYRVNVQCEGRIDRANTPFDILYYYRLISDSKIDKAIMRSIKNKKDFNAKTYFWNSQKKHTL